MTAASRLRLPRRAPLQRRTRDASRRFDRAPDRPPRRDRSTAIPERTRARDPRRRDPRIRREGLRRRARRFDRAQGRHQQADALPLLRRQGGALPRRARGGLRRHPRRRGDARPRRTATRRTALRELALFTWRYFVEHPEFISLLNTENLMRARFLKGSKRIREMQTHLVRELTSILRARRAAGRLRRRPRSAARLSDDRLAVGLLPVEPVHALGDLRPRARRRRRSSPPGRRMSSRARRTLAWTSPRVRRASRHRVQRCASCIRRRCHCRTDPAVSN